MSLRTTTIVVPCFNEADRLHAEQVKHYLVGATDVGILFVDDGSTDGTDIILNDLAKWDSSAVHVVVLQANCGKAEAVRIGMSKAIDDGAHFAGYWDADFATPLDEVTAFREVLAENPDILVVLGSRVRLLGRRIERKALRHYTGRMFATLAAVILGVPIYDTQCGAKLFRATPEVRELFAERFGSRWIFDVELLARLKVLQNQRGRLPLERVALEYPLTAWRDVPGSKVEWPDLIGSVFELLRIYRCYRLDRKRQDHTP